MSTTSTEAAHGEAVGHHPTPRDYVRIASILAFLTALEVSTYYLDFGSFGVPLLVILMVIKFALVAGEFMHLKYDTRVYRRLMVTGLTFAVVLYTVTLVLFVIDRSYLA